MIDVGLARGPTIAKSILREVVRESTVEEIPVIEDTTQEIVTEIVVTVIGIVIVAEEIVDQEEMMIVARTVMRDQNLLAVKPLRKGAP